MDFIEIRNSLIKKMWEHLQHPVILSDQASPETKYPYIYYNVIGPPKGLNGTGDNRIITKDNDAYTVLHDQPTATFSFTACSQNRTEDVIVLPYASAGVIDRNGFLSAILAVKVSEVTGEPTAAKLAVVATECDTADGTYTAVADTHLFVNGSELDIDIKDGLDANLDLDLIGCKRYIKLTITVTLTGGTTPSSTNAYAIALGDSKVILGDDEAMELSEKAIHFLEHIGYKELSLLGIVVVEISNEGQRSGLVVDEIDRRYGFDCRIRFEHTTERNDGSVENINFKKGVSNP